MKDMHYNIATDTFGITLWEDDNRITAASIHLTRTMSQSAAGHRRYEYIGDREQVRKFAECLEERNDDDNNG